MNEKLNQKESEMSVVEELKLKVAKEKAVCIENGNNEAAKAYACVEDMLEEKP